MNNYHTTFFFGRSLSLLCVFLTARASRKRRSGKPKTQAATTTITKHIKPNLCTFGAHKYTNYKMYINSFRKERENDKNKNQKKENKLTLNEMKHRFRSLGKCIYCTNMPLPLVCIQIYAYDVDVTKKRLASYRAFYCHGH